MKLYDLQKGAKLYETLGTMVGNVWTPSNDEDDPVIFDHLDGAYSYCYLQSDPKIVVHISAAAPLVRYKDGYKLETDNGPSKSADEAPANGKRSHSVPVS